MGTREYTEPLRHAWAARPDDDARIPLTNDGGSHINPYRRSRLGEVQREGAWRIFRSTPANAYRLSIQASGAHHCARERVLPVEDYGHWEVAVFTADGSWVTPETHPEIVRGRIVEPILGPGRHGRYR